MAVDDKDDNVQRQKMEMNLTRRFIKAIERKVDELSAASRSKTITTDGGPPQPQFQLEKEEMQAIMEINNHGLLEGVVAGIVSFVVLRKIRSSILQRFQNQAIAAMRQNTTSSGTSSHRTTAPPKSPFRQQTTTDSIEPSPLATSAATSAAATAAAPRTGPLYGILAWMLDVTVSFYIAAYVSLRNPDALLEQIADLPLVPGKSNLSREFCPVVLAEYQSIMSGMTTTTTPNTEQQQVLGTPALQQDFDDNDDDDTSNNHEYENNTAVLHQQQQDILQNPQTSLLKAMVRFCYNCHSRMSYEQLLRQQQGLGPRDPVTIPPSGVPRNSNSEMNPIDLKMLQAVGAEQQQHPDFLDDSQPSSSSDNDGTIDDDDSWAIESFVTDQEEDKKRQQRRK